MDKIVRAELGVITEEKSVDQPLIDEKYVKTTPKIPTSGENIQASMSHHLTHLVNEQTLQFEIDALLHGRTVHEQSDEDKGPETTRQEIQVQTQVVKSKNVLNEPAPSSKIKKAQKQESNRNLVKQLFSTSASDRYAALKQTTLGRVIDFEANERVAKDITAAGVFGLDQDIKYERPAEEQTMATDPDRRSLSSTKTEPFADEVDIGDLTVLHKREMQQYHEEDFVAGGRHCPLTAEIVEKKQKQKMRDKLNMHIGQMFFDEGDSSLSAVEKRRAQRQDAIRTKVRDEMTERFGFNKMQQEFQRAIKRDAPVIFGELSAQEIAEIERKQEEKRQRKELLEKMKKQEADHEAFLKGVTKAELQKKAQEEESRNKEKQKVTLSHMDPSSFDDRAINTKAHYYKDKEVEELNRKKAEAERKKKELEELLKQRKLRPQWAMKDLNVYEMEQAGLNDIDVKKLEGENLTFGMMGQSKLLDEIGKKRQRRRRGRSSHKLLNTVRTVDSDDRLSNDPKLLGLEIERALHEYETIQVHNQPKGNTRAVQLTEEQEKAEKKRKTTTRHRVLSDEIDHELIQMLEKNYNERREKRKACMQILDEMVRDGKGETKRARRLRNTIKSFESDSNSQSSGFDSASSRVNFWKDINTKDDDYKNAVIVKGRGEEKAKQKFYPSQKKMSPGVSESESDMVSTPRKKKKQGKGGGRQVEVIAIKSYEDQLDKMRFQMQKQSKDFMQEKRLIKKSAVTYAITYYKNKSKELTQIFTTEGLRMLEKYTQLRRHLIERDDQLKMAAARTIIQESIIMELRQFIEEHLDPAMRVMERLEQTTKMQSTYVPCRSDEDDEDYDPRNIDPRDREKERQRVGGAKGGDGLGLYQSTVQQRVDKSALQILREKVMDLETEIAVLRIQNDAVEDTKAILEREATDAVERAQKLEEINKDLEAQMKFLKTQCEDEVRILKLNIEGERKAMKEARLQMASVCEQESQVNQTIIKKVLFEVEKLARTNRMLKNVLRVPRLNDQFQTKFQRIIAKEENDAGKREKVLKEMMDQAEGEAAEDDAAAVNAALQIQFCHEYDFNALRDRVLSNVAFLNARKGGGAAEIKQPTDLLNGAKFDEFKAKLQGIIDSYQQQAQVPNLFKNSGIKNPNGQPKKNNLNIIKSVAKVTSPMPSKITSGRRVLDSDSMRRHVRKDGKANVRTLLSSSDSIEAGATTDSIVQGRMNDETNTSNRIREKCLPVDASIDASPFHVGGFEQSSQPVALALGTARPVWRIDSPSTLSMGGSLSSQLHGTQRHPKSRHGARARNTAVEALSASMDLMLNSPMHQPVPPGWQQPASTLDAIGQAGSRIHAFMSSRMPRAPLPLTLSLNSKQTAAMSAPDAESRLLTIQRQLFTHALKLQEQIQGAVSPLPESQPTLAASAADLDLAETLLQQIAQVLGYNVDTANQTMDHNTNDSILDKQRRRLRTQGKPLPLHSSTLSSTINYGVRSQNDTGQKRDLHIPQLRDSFANAARLPTSATNHHSNVPHFRDTFSTARPMSEIPPDAVQLPSPVASRTRAVVSQRRKLPAPNDSPTGGSTSKSKNISSSRKTQRPLENYDFLLKKSAMRKAGDRKQANNADITMQMKTTKHSVKPSGNMFSFDDTKGAGRKIFSSAMPRRVKVTKPEKPQKINTLSEPADFSVINPGVVEVPVATVEASAEPSLLLNITVPRDTLPLKSDLLHSDMGPTTLERLNERDVINTVRIGSPGDPSPYPNTVRQSIPMSNVARQERSSEQRLWTQEHSSCSRE